MKKFRPFCILSEFWLSRKIIDFDILIHTFWAQMTCMRARNSGKVSMEAEFYAEDKTRHNPYAYFNFTM